MRRNQTDPVFDWLAYHAEFDPGRLAAVDLATQRWLTYGEFNDRATRLATALRERFGVAEAQVDALARERVHAVRGVAGERQPVPGDRRRLEQPRDRR